MISKRKYMFTGPLHKVQGIQRCVIVDKADQDNNAMFHHSPSGDYRVIGGLIRKDKPIMVSGQTVVAVMR